MILSIVIIVSLLIVFVLIDFRGAMQKDLKELKNQSLSEKFSEIVKKINNDFFENEGEIVELSIREFNLVSKREIVIFQYSSGHLSIRYENHSRMNKSFYHEQEFRNIRNITLNGQIAISEAMIKGMCDVVEKELLVS